MKLRCNNVKNASFPNYGGKGISYCERWESFELFLADMGERPDGRTLDRIDRCKDYSPENCRWATVKEQNQDRGNTVWLEHNGERLCLADWTRKTGIKETTITYRLKAGWSVDRALSTPPRPLRQQAA
jgi:hypothetical protein